MTQFDTAKFWNGVLADHNAEMKVAVSEKAGVTPDDLRHLARISNAGQVERDALFDAADQIERLTLAKH